MAWKGGNLGITGCWDFQEWISSSRKNRKVRRYGVELWQNPVFERVMEKVHCDRLSNSLPKISTSQCLVHVSMLLYMAKGTVQCD